MLLSRSSDEGLTWTPPAVIATPNLTDKCGGLSCIPNTNDIAYNIPSIAVFGSGDTARVYVCFWNWTGTQMQVAVATSLDGGQSFGLPVPVAPKSSGDQFFPWIALANDGTLAVTWLDRRNDPANVTYQPFFTTSKDGFVFSPARSLSITQSDLNAPGANILFRNHVWAGRTMYAVWTDTRSGVSRLELGGAKF